MDELTDAQRERAERLFWQRSQSFLRGDHHVDLSAVWHRCVRDVLRNEADGGMHLLLAKVARTPRETLDVPPWSRKSLGMSGDDNDSSVDGYLSVFGNTDLVNDVVCQGAYTKTLAEAQAFARTHGTDALWPLLWQHAQDEPIGAITAAREDQHGLRIHAVVNTDCDRGRQAYGGLKAGVLSFSIGYRPIKYTYTGSTRNLKEVALLEGSVVTFAANREARPLAG